MVLNDIKKELYKSNVLAFFQSADKENLWYHAHIIKGNDVTGVEFMIPIKELGDTRWFQEMLAKHLIRYIVF